MNKESPKKKLSAQERLALKIFFWFSLAFTLLLLKAHPSKETVGFVAVVIYLGYRLFSKKTDSVSAPEPATTDAAHWSKISMGQGLFIALCTFATPFAFGVRSANIVYFILCWLGLFFGCASIITLKIIKDGQRKNGAGNE